MSRAEKLYSVRLPAEELRWVKASRSLGTGACVELAKAGDHIALRDSKNPHIHLLYTHEEIAAFLDGAKHGEFDDLLNRSS